MAQTSVVVSYSSSSSSSLADVDQVYCSSSKSDNGGLISSDYPGSELGLNSSSSTAPTNSLLRRQTKTTIRTLQNRDIQIKEDFKTVSELKHILVGNVLNPNDINIIAGGKRLLNDLCFSPQDLSNLSKKCYVFIAASSKNTITLTFHDTKTKKATSTTFPVSARVFHVKRELFRRKITPLRPEEQRIIVVSKVLSDSAIIGDYIIGQAGVKSSQQLNFYVSEQTNAKHEVDISVGVTFARDPKTSVNISLEISQPLSMLSMLLALRHGLPPPNPMFVYVYAMHSSTGGGDGGEPLTLNPSKSLLDYGITQSTKTLKLRMFQMLMPRRAPNPILEHIDNHHNLYLLNAMIIADSKVLAEVERSKRERKSKNNIESSKGKSESKSESKSTVVAASTGGSSSQQKRSSQSQGLFSKKEKDQVTGISSSSPSPSVNNTQQQPPPPPPPPPQQQQQQQQTSSSSTSSSSSSSSSTSTGATTTMPQNTKKRPSSSTSSGMFKGMKKGFLGSNKQTVMAAVKPSTEPYCSSTSSTPQKTKPPTTEN